MNHTAEESAQLTRRGLLVGLAASAATVALPAASLSESDRDFDAERFGYPAPVAEILRHWNRLPAPPNPKWVSVNGPWRYGKGKASEGLHATAAQFPIKSAPVTVPHRVLEPDTPLWYRTRLTATFPVAVRVSADDGSHVYVDGTRIAAKNRHFLIERAGEATTDLIVRVLNKAVYGGLGSVEVCPLDEFRAYETATGLRDRLERAIAKLKKIPRPGRPLLDSFSLAVGAVTIASLDSLEHQLDRFPMLSIGPVVHQVSANSAVIAWETDAKVNPQLVWRIEDGSPHKAKIESDGRFHRALLEGLEPDAVVAYQLRMKGFAAETLRFRSLPARPVFTFSVWADSHIGFQRFRQTVGAMLFGRDAFTVGIGDLVVDAADKRPWEQFFELGAPLFSSTPSFFTGGNHDYDDCFEDLNSVYFNRYARLDRKPFYAWTVANCRFVALDPNIQFPTGIDSATEQHTWLMQELESSEWKQATWRFVFIHQPPYGRGWTDYAGDLPIRKLLDGLIEPHKIDFVVSGHIHDYERLTKTYGNQTCTFLVVGGAGGALEDGPNNPEPIMDIVSARHHFGRFTIENDRVAFDAFCTDTTPLDHYECKK